MNLLMPHQPAQQATHSITESESIAAPHLHVSTGQQKLLSTPPTAQPSQQAPRVLHHKPIPSYPAVLKPRLRSTPRQAHRSGTSCEPSAYDQSRQQFQQAKSDCDMLQLLTGSRPVRSAHELLARLSSADTAAAMPTAACMYTPIHQHTSGRQATLMQTRSVFNPQEDEATSAPTGPNQSILNSTLSDSPAQLSQASGATAIELNEAGWQEKRSRPSLKRAAPCRSSAEADKKARAAAVGTFCTGAQHTISRQSIL